MMVASNGTWKPGVALSGSYLVELDRWSIKNDGTDAVNTTLGINNAISWAEQNDFSEIVFPNGIYLIDETTPIAPKSFMTLNLGGGTFKIRNNNLESYTIVKFSEVQYSRITNGILEGDRETHMYTKDGIGSDTHEGGTGVNVYASKNISVDNLEIYNLTGDACNSTNKGGNIDFYLRAATCQYGSFDPVTGAELVNLNKIRWTNSLDVANPLIANIGYFTLAGTGYGSLGSDITSTHYDVFFYREDNTFISAKTKIEFFSRVEPPKEAKWAKFSLYQAAIPSDDKNNLMIWTLKFAENVFFERVNVHHCRRQGMSLQGQFIYIRDSNIHHIGGSTFQTGTDPQGGIDIEDGYDWNQHFYIERNNFHDNWGYDLIITNGKYMYVNGNKFNRVSKYVSVALNAPIDKSIFINNIVDQGQVVISGEFLVENNQFFGSNITFGDLDISKNYGRSIVISECSFLNCTVTIGQTVPYTITVEGSKFVNNSFKDIFFNNSLILKSEAQIIKNCIIDGDDKNGAIYNNFPQKGWILQSVIFKNITKPISLPPGKYIGCKFLNINVLSLATSPVIKDADIEFIDCEIKSLDQNNTLLTIGNAKSFKVENCLIEKKDSILFAIQNITEEIIIKGNTLKYPNAVFTSRSPIAIQSTFTGRIIIIDSNYMYTSMKKKAFVNTSTNVPVIFKNNVLIGFEIERTNEISFNNVLDGGLDS